MKDKIILYCNRIIEYCLYFLIFCLPFAKAGIQVFCWAAILFWLIKKVICLQIPFRSPLPPTKLNKPLLIFIVVCALSTVLSVDFSLSLKALLTKVIKNAIIFFIVVETINNKTRLRNILVAIIASASLITVDAGVQLFRGTDFLRGFSGSIGELRASFSSRNGFGGWLIVISPIVLGLLATRQFILGKMRRIGLGILFCLLLICLGMTYSRASWLGFVLSFGFISCYLISFLSNRAKILSVIIIILSFSGLYFTLPQKMKDRAGSITRIENSSSFRINLWKESLQIIEDFPLAGIGLNTYSQIAPLYSKGEGGYYPHNSYLQLAAETGIIGLFSFLWIIIKLFKLGLHFLKDRKEPLILGLLTALSAFLIHSFFDVNLYALQLATLFWFVLGLAIASINMLTMNKSTPT